MLSRTLWLAALALLLALPVHAAYVKRYTTIENGGMTYTGNTLGLDKASNSNSPGTEGSIGTFITTNTSLRDASPSPGWPDYKTTYNAGTTSSWASNSSSAQLRMPAGSTVLYAELIWGGSYLVGSQDVSGSLGTYVTFTTPAKTSNVYPDSATAKTLGGSTSSNYYVRSADVTNLVKAGGAGLYTVGHVPGTETTSGVTEANNANACGWTLAVIYKNIALPPRNMTIFVGAELTVGSTEPISAVTGFCTPGSGTITGRMMVSAIEGDANITGDGMRFGAQNPPTGVVFGPNNPSTNFFCGQINKDDGTRDTAGTFGTLNHAPGAPVNGGRTGWDITNVPVSAFLVNSQQTAYAQGTTSLDRYTITSIGLQIDVGAPIFPLSVMSVDKPATYVGDILTYTVRLDNTAGTADALNVSFKNTPPAGLSFIAGSLTIDGIAAPTANPTTGVAVGTVAAKSIRTLVYKMHVNFIPPAPAIAQYLNNATWTYQYQSCPFMPLNNGTATTTPDVVTYVPRLQIEKTSNPATKLFPGDPITYTITVRNDGTYATTGTTLTDPIPEGLTYVANSTRLNGVLVADNAGQMPFAVEQNINSPGTGIGQVAINGTATVTFQAVSNGTKNTITNIANIDVDGSGNPAPVQAAAVSNPPIYADLSVTVTDGQTEVVAGAPVTYVVTVANAGPDWAANPTLLLDLPGDLQNATFTPSVGIYDPQTGSWTGLTLNPGQSATITIQATVAPSATEAIVITANVAPPLGVGDQNMANNYATDTDTLLFNADLAITKTNGVNFVQPGANTTYTITVTNNGPSAVSSMTVVDTLPAQLLNPVFTPSMGIYNAENGVWNGAVLLPGQSATLTLAGTVQTGVSGSLVNSVTVSPSAGVVDPYNANNTAVDTDTLGTPSYTISGTLYEDLNHNSTCDGQETGTGVTGLYAKLRRSSGGNAVKAVAINATTGAYQFTAVTTDTYTIFLDNNSTLSDVTPYLPSGWISTQAPGQTISNVVVETADLTEQNLGLWHGSMLSGTVFADTGTGTGGIANDGLKNGTESGIPGVSVKATNTAGSTTYDSTTTDASGNYTLWIPSTAGTGTVKVVETNLATYLSIAGRAGSTGGTYTRTTDTVAFTNAPGTIYTGVTFADLPVNLFTNDGQQTVPLGSVAFYPHLFTAGSTGQVTFSASHVANPALTGWNILLYRDTNANGVLDAGEPQLTGAVPVTAGGQVAIIVKVFAPTNAPEDARDTVTVTASMVYTCPAPTEALTVALAHTDLTIISLRPGLTLTKTVDKAAALPGEVVTYSITYRNNSEDPLAAIIIRDVIPTFTRFVSAAYGTLPTNITGCTLTTPAVNGTGQLVWTFIGTLTPSASGTVSFQVQVEQ